MKNGTQMSAKTYEKTYFQIMSKIQPDHQKLISESNAFVKAKTDSVQKLASQSIAIELKQGQTLLRADHIETHCFILEGSLRLLQRIRQMESCLLSAKLNEVT